MGRVENREIEKKFVLELEHTGPTIASSMVDALDVCIEEVKKFTKISKYTNGVDIDYYWKLSKNSTLRLRDKSADDGPGELTVKLRDKGDNVNRREENLMVASADQALTVLRLIHGPEEGSVSKFFVKFKFKGGEVAIYKVLSDHTVYLEVEAPTVKMVDRVVSKLKKRLNLNRETRSMYELYVRKNGKKK